MRLYTKRKLFFIIFNWKVDIVFKNTRDYILKQYTRFISAHWHMALVRSSTIIKSHTRVIPIHFTTTFVFGGKIIFNFKLDAWRHEIKCDTFFTWDYFFGSQYKRNIRWNNNNNSMWRRKRVNHGLLQGEIDVMVHIWIFWFIAENVQF